MDIRKWLPLVLVAITTGVIVLFGALSYRFALDTGTAREITLLKHVAEAEATKWGELTRSADASPGTPPVRPGPGPSTTTVIDAEGRTLAGPGLAALFQGYPPPVTTRQLLSLPHRQGHLPIRDGQLIWVSTPVPGTAYTLLAAYRSEAGARTLLAGVSTPWLALIVIGALLAAGAAALLVRSVAARLDRQQAQWLSQVEHDPLTGLANRNSLLRRLSQIIEDHGSRPLALLIMDLDRFREINETLGHAVGDEVLKQAAVNLGQSLLHAEITARLGGDEFAVLLPVADHGAAVAAAHQIQGALAPVLNINDIEINMQANIGIALFPEHGGDAGVLIRCAEVAMYKAKQEGRSHIIYAQELDPYNIRRLMLMNDLRRAIEGRQLVLYYQPKVDLRTNRTVGVEALLRWQHPIHGFIPPNDFIPLAEQSELIRHLTYWVIDEALLQCRAWRQLGISLDVAVNLSARNLHDPGLPAKVAGLLAKWSVPAARLTLEITENAIMIDPERALKILERLHSMGIRLSIDDFGTGYSSLVYLKKLPVSQIKIDRSFVMDMISDENDAIIVRSTIDLGHNLGCQIVAEGVENKEILQHLKTLGCDYAQGYHLSRPVSSDELIAWLSQSSWALEAVPTRRAAAQ